MAYATGSVSSFDDLITAIHAALTANGWTLTSGVIHKGAAHVKLSVVSSNLYINMGTGNDGAGNLTGSCPYSSRIGSLSTTAVSFPLTYEAHIFNSPDEVYIVVNYSTVYWQYLFFGLSDIPGITGGQWFAATKWTGGGGDFTSSPSGGNTQFGFGAANGCPAFYCQSYTVTDGGMQSFINHGLDSRTWTDKSDTANLGISFGVQNALLSALPSAWNGETVLLPYPVYVPRTTGNKISLVADLKNIRHCRNDFIADGDLITLGSDKWKVYPWYRKNSAVRNGVSSGGGGDDHSGTVAFAVRYTGP